MKFKESQKLANIAEILGCEFVGQANHPVLGINEIHVVQAGDVVFVDHPKYYDKALNSAATTILINKKVEAPKGKGLLISEDPFRDFNHLAQHFNPFVAASASIAPTASIGQGTVVQPSVFIGNNVRIGKNCIIHGNVSIYDNTQIGDDVVIHANTVIGADAFYYKKRETGYDRLLSSGNVHLKDKVEIGASCTIDRGVTASTTIGYGTKIDNHVQIGHDTVVGEHCLFASQVGIAGCVVVEDHVTMWGQVGVTSGVTIGEGAVLYAQSGISQSLEGGKKYFGSPADEAMKKYREMNAVKALPEVLKKMKS